jgi:hypothetical protein
MTIFAPSIRIHVTPVIPSPLPELRTYYFVNWDWLLERYEPGVRDLGVDKDGNRGMGHRGVPLATGA